MKTFNIKSNSHGFSILILAVTAFVIVTTEYIIVGLLPALARDLDISIALAGQLVTLFAFTVMLFSPVLTTLLSQYRTETVICGDSVNLHGC